jgi:hypothetical protein
MVRRSTVFDLDILACTLVYTPACIRACIQACIPACILAFIPAFTPACIRDSSLAADNRVFGQQQRLQLKRR